MSKGGYRGGSTVLKSNDKAWFSKPKAEPPKVDGKLTPEERVARIAALNNERDGLQLRLNSVTGRLKKLREQQLDFEIVQRKKQEALLINSKHGRIMDRREESLQNTISNLFSRNRDQN